MEKDAKEQFLFDRFLERLLKPLHQLFYLAATNGEGNTFEGAKRWSVKAEAIDGPHVATSRWIAAKLDCHGEELSLKSRRTLLREYRGKRDHVED